MKFRIHRDLSIAVCLLFTGSVVAQEAPQMPGPEKEHKWLDKFVGQWVTESKAFMGPDGSAIECSGTLSSRSLGGFWVVNEMKGDFQGTPTHGVQTIGYDVEKKKYIGTWIDSMTSHLWHYEGSLDKEGKTLTLNAEGPNLMSEGKMAKYQDVFEFTSENELRMTSRMLDEDENWVDFMTGTAKRNFRANSR